jgi:hypothetical protein
MSSWRGWWNFAVRNIALASHANNQTASLPSPLDERPCRLRALRMSGLHVPLLLLLSLYDCVFPTNPLADLLLDI